jgi:predicted transcriptional regulator
MTTMLLRMPAPLKAAVDRRAESANLSRSEVVRRALADAIEERA